MSKPRYDWWSYMKAISRKYYARKGKELHGIAAKEQIAVEAAVEETKGLPGGSDRMKVVDLVLLRATHRIPGAALEVHISERTAQRWHADFIKLVAKYYGLFEVLDKSWR